MEQITLAISGMSCGGCVSKVSSAIAAIPGAQVDAVTVGSATVSYDDARTTPAVIAQSIRDAGYEIGAGGTSALAGAGARTGRGCCG
jgi:copper chaperone